MQQVEEQGEMSRRGPVTWAIVETDLDIWLLVRGLQFDGLARRRALIFEFASAELDDVANLNVDLHDDPFGNRLCDAGGPFVFELKDLDLW